MAQLSIVKGGTKKLPAGQSYTAGLGWDPAAGGTSVDLDVWVLRTHKDGTVDAIYWGNEAWKRPDLGTNGSGLPYIATPELDVIHEGDDLTGAESADGYDERVKLATSKALDTVVQYAMFVTKYGGGTLGEATNIKCGIKEDESGHEYVAKVEDENAFDISALVATVDRTDTGWTMTNVSKGYTDDMPTIARKAGVKGI